MSRSAWTRRKSSRSRARHLRRALARPAGEKEQRIGLRVAAQRGQHDDLQIDRAALSRLAVLEDPQRAAVRVGRAFVSRAGMETIEAVGA